MSEFHLSQLAGLKVRELDKIYSVGGIVRPSSLLGEDLTSCEWAVTMLTGFIPNMNTPWIRHRKRFVPTGTTSSWTAVQGRNEMWTDTEWGFFHVWGDGLKRDTVLDYGEVAANSFLTRRIRDRIRTTGSADELIGRFNVRWRGRERFLGYFALTRRR